MISKIFGLFAKNAASAAPSRSRPLGRQIFYSSVPPIPSDQKPASPCFEEGMESPKTVIAPSKP